MLDMASAYGTFAADGIHADAIVVTRVEDAGGRVLFAAGPTRRQVISPEVAGQVTAALNDVVRRGTGQEARIGRPVAGKTGTSEGYFDAWFVGYTPELSAAVWVGFPQGDRALEAPNTPYTITGGAWPAQIWSRFASAALSGTPYAEPPEGGNQDLVEVEIDLTTGFLAGPNCPRSQVARASGAPHCSAPTVVCPMDNPPGLAASPAGTVPDVSGIEVAQAVGLLEAAGYRVEADWTPERPGWVPGLVMIQQPLPGSPLPHAGTVSLRVGGPEPGSVLPMSSAWSWSLPAGCWPTTA